MPKSYSLTLASERFGLDEGDQSAVPLLAYSTLQSDGDPVGEGVSRHRQAGRRADGRAAALCPSR